MPYQLIQAQRLTGQLALSKTLQLRHRLPPSINLKQLLEQKMTPSLSTDRILQAVREARYLTISQIARMFYSKKKDGSAPNVMPRQPRPGEIYNPVPGWDNAYQQIRRMVLREEIKLAACTVHGKKIPQVERLIMLPKEKLSYQKWEHEIARAECYVALHKTGKLNGYRSKWSTDEFHAFAKQHGVYFDSQFELEGSKLTYFLEVDMGTEYWNNELDEKVREYAGLAESMPQYPFCVVFVAKNKPGVERKERLRAFGHCFTKHGRAGNFVVTDLDLFTNDPLGKIFGSDRLTAPASLFGV